MSYLKEFLKAWPQKWTYISIGVMLSSFLIDRILKYLVTDVYKLVLFERHEVLPFFHLTYVQNHGISFGLLSSTGFGRWLLVAFSLIVCVGLFGWIKQQTKPLRFIALSLIIGGALGNAYDRALYGYVVDFLDLNGLFFPWIFNPADVSINIGVGLLFWTFFTEKDDRDAQKSH